MNKKNQLTSHPIVGIDLGTTNSAVAVISQGKPQIISSAQGQRIIPSVVHVDLKKKIIVGQDAHDALIAMPERTIAAVKRKMGSKEKINLAEKLLSSEEIAALILRELKQYVDREYGSVDKEAVITVPAHFNNEQRQATKRAGELAGFIVERIINEPTAAAMAFGYYNQKENGNILVYDLGGGTFDVSVVEIIDGILEVKSSAGDNNLGGEDFDWQLAELMAQKFETKYGIDPLSNLQAKAILKDEAEKAKKELSFQEKIAIEIPLLMIVEDQPRGLTLEFSRDQLVELIGPSLKKTINKIDEALAAAKLEPEEVDQILLVGGSSRIPWISQEIKKIFGKAPRADVQPDEAVALGAAVQAGLKSGVLKSDNFIVTDVAPYSLGIAVLREYRERLVPGGFHALIKKNDTIPITEKDIFTTALFNQTAVDIEVYQGEESWANSNMRLGNFLLQGIPEGPPGQEKIEVSFHYNLNGILEVAAKSISTGKKMMVTLTDAIDRESEESYQQSQKKLNEFLDQQSQKQHQQQKELDEIIDQMITEEDKEEFEPVEETVEELWTQLIKIKEQLKITSKKLTGEEKQRLLDLINSYEEQKDQKLQKEDLQHLIDRGIDALIDYE